MGNHRVLVIGESCLDIFTYVNATRLAPDLPIPILNVDREVTNPGMAANVARNLVALNCDVTLLTNPNWETVTKNRFMDSRTNHAFVRIDRNDDIDPCIETPAIEGFDAVVISDYDKGFVSREMIQEISKNHRRTFLDSKKSLGDFALEVEAIKINEFEFEKSREYVLGNLFSKTVVTMGSKGATYLGNQFEVDPVQVGDSSGAGDAFFAQLVYSRLEGMDMENAISSANYAARKVVGQRGVAVIN